MRFCRNVNDEMWELDTLLPNQFLCWLFWSGFGDLEERCMGGECGGKTESSPESGHTLLYPLCILFLYPPWKWSSQRERLLNKIIITLLFLLSLDHYHQRLCLWTFNIRHYSCHNTLSIITYHYLIIIIIIIYSKILFSSHSLYINTIFIHVICIIFGYT